MDINKTATLLHIADTSHQWPNLAGITGLAMAELLEINAEAAAILAKKAEEARLKAEKEAAEVAAKAKAEEEKAAREATQTVESPIRRPERPAYEPAPFNPTRPMERPI